MKTLDIIIIGAGPAGLSAAVYAQRAGLATVVLESSIYGGQIANTPEVENYPAVEKVSGFDFAMNLYNQAVSFGAQVELEAAESVTFAEDGHQVKTASQEFRAPTIIIANGVKRRKLECPGEEEFSGKGVSYCATCDGAFYRGKDVAIVGGGNTALEDALYLANNCRTVHLIHRRDAFRASQVIVDAVLQRENIVVHYDSKVERIAGDKKVTGLELMNLESSEKQLMELSGVFVAVGLIPDNGMYAPAVALDESGYILAGEDCKTSAPGVFAAGDTRTKTLRQLVTAAADGAVAANEAVAYLQTHR